MTFSQVAACIDGVAVSTPASESPPVFRRSLWQVTQYLLMVAAAVGPVVCAAIAMAAATRNDVIRRYISPMRAPVIALIVGSLASSAFAGTRLIDAVKRGDAAAVRTLIAKKADVNAPDADGSTALHWAAQRDDVLMADLLIAAGASVKAKTRYNVT